MAHASTTINAHNVKDVNIISTLSDKILDELTIVNPLANTSINTTTSNVEDAISKDVEKKIMI